MWMMVNLFAELSFDDAYSWTLCFFRQVFIKGKIGRINPEDDIMGWLNRRGRKLKKLLICLILMAQVLKLSVAICAFDMCGIFLFIYLFCLLLYFPGTIDAKELNVAMRYEYWIIFDWFLQAVSWNNYD